MTRSDAAGSKRAHSRHLKYLHLFPSGVCIEMMGSALKATVEIDCCETETIRNRFLHTRGMCRQQGDRRFDALTFHEDGGCLKIYPRLQYGMRALHDRARFSVGDQIIRKR